VVVGVVEDSMLLLFVGVCVGVCVPFDWISQNREKEQVTVACG
jgi:putative effector of murein hydrolase LrgA (UPF0299 family)